MFRLLLLCVFAAIPVVSHAQDMPLTQVLIDGEEWEEISSGHKFTEGPAVDRDGLVYFADVPSSEIFRIEKDGTVTKLHDAANRTSGLMFHPDGRLIGCQNGGKQIVAYTLSDDGKSLSTQVLVKDTGCNDLAVSSTGHIYWTDPKSEAVWHRSPDGTVSKAASGFRPNGVVLSGNEGSLVVTDNAEAVLWTYRILEDGSLDSGAPYYAPLQIPSGQERPGSDGMTVDDAGRLYVATHAGLQMWDPTGRLGGTIAKPQNAFLSNAVFGGPEFGYLYVTCADKVYRRKVKPRGVPSILIKRSKE